MKKNRICPVCGEPLPSGRTNMKFCSVQCRNRYNNSLKRCRKSYMGSVDRQIRTNYSVLENMLALGVSRMGLSEMMSIGFNPCYSTLCRKEGCHLVYGCYDILYQITPLSISNIRRMSLNLQNRRLEVKQAIQTE